jgi:ribose 5-phosphate isomerase A
MTPPTQRQLKERVALQAVTFVESDMVVGLGAGSTAAIAIERIAQLVKEGTLRGITGVSCSREVERLARSVGLNTASLSDRPHVDLTIDGADEVDDDLNLIKGAGGALLYEKMVAQASRREIIIVDEGKLSPWLGTRASVPVEVIGFGWRAEELFLRELGTEPTLRVKDGHPFVTDEGNLILDCKVAPIADTPAFARRLEERAGIVDHGIFVGLATDVLVGTSDGVKHLVRRK